MCAYTMAWNYNICIEQMTIFPHQFHPVYAPIMTDVHTVSTVTSASRALHGVPYLLGLLLMYIHAVLPVHPGIHLHIQRH